jgi:hypothetical protein
MCPKCGSGLIRGVDYCQNCGDFVGAWPIGPDGRPNDAPLPDKLLTKYPLLDMFVGFLAGTIAMFFCFYAVVLFRDIHAKMPRYKALQLGVMAGLILAGAIMLGAFTTCLFRLDRGPL